MKTIALTISLTLFTSRVFAQILIALVFGEKLQTDKLAFGLTVSPTLSVISNTESSMKSGLGLGVYFDIKLSENFFLHAEAFPKASFGAKGITPYPTGDKNLDALFANGTIERKIRAMSLPVLAKYRIKGLLFAELGPQGNLILKVKDIYESEVNDNDATYTTDVMGQFKRLDFGIAAGVTLKLKKDKGMGLGIRYYYGLTDIMKSAAGMQHNEAWSFNVSIPVGTGAAQENAANME